MDNIQHGGALDRAIATFGGRKADWLDLSTGINPNPYPVPKIPDELWQRLPDENLMDDCLAAARTYYGVPSEGNLVAAPGTQALIQLLPRATQAKKVWIVGPTYNEYERVFGSLAEVIVSTELPRTVDDIDLIIVGSPNNPDVRVCDCAEVSALGRIIHTRGGFVLIDAAFCDVLSSDEAPPAALSDADGVVIFRSFGKFFGLAGLRLGFAVGGENVLNRFRTALGPWAVSGPALFVGAKALRDQAWINAARSRLSGKRACVENLLCQNGLTIVGATDLFVTTSQPSSALLAKSLAQRNILVRTFDYNPDWIRFGLPAEHTDFARLEKVLAQPG